MPDSAVELDRTMHAIVDSLNEAFRADPGAMHALVVNRVPCNQSLADHPTVVVDVSPVFGGEEMHFSVGAIGLINGVLGAAGLLRIASAWSEDRDEEGRAKFVGFAMTPHGYGRQ